MKALAPIPFTPGQTQVQVPRDAKPVGVAIKDASVVLLAEINPITADAIAKVTWLIHGVTVGTLVSIPDKAEYAGVASVPLPDGGMVAVAAYVEANPILLPS